MAKKKKEVKADSGPAMMTIDRLINKTESEDLKAQIEKADKELNEMPKKEKVFVGEVNEDLTVIFLGPHPFGKQHFCLLPENGEKEGKDYHLSFKNNHCATQDQKEISLMENLILNEGNPNGYRVIHIGDNVKTKLKLS